MATLVLLQGGEANPYELTAEETVLGRHPDCTIQLQSNMVSRRHARVCRNGEEFVLEDLGSGNGTFVNGRRIEGPTPLQHEDRIKLGPMLLRFEASGAKPPARRMGEFSPEATALNINIASGEHDLATIMSTAERASGFGVLEVQPEAKLKGVLEISRSLAGVVDLQALLPKILDTLFKIFPQADRGCILLKEDESGKMIPKAVKHRRPGDDESVKLSRTILHTVLEQKAGILSADAANDARFEASESISALTIRSMLCVPMLDVNGEPLGVIHLDTQNSFNQFRKDDLDLLMAVAGQAALSYDTARLMTISLEKQRQDREMQIARTVQRALLPEHLPRVAGYEFAASYEAAQAVGGDYYDCLVLPDGRVCLAFGDVAGKGVPASLVMSRLSSIVPNTVEFVEDLGQAVARINNQMCAKAVEGRFVTFVLAVIETNHQLSAANAGHLPLMIRRTDGSVDEFGQTAVGLPLGVMEDYEFQVVRRPIEPGEMVVIYTDGVSEAMNPKSELYGLERLREVIGNSRASTASELCAEIREDVRRHANGRAQNDDITLMVFGRLRD